MSVQDLSGAAVLADGIKYGESPRWHDGELWFSDVFDNRVCRLTPRGVETVVELPGPSGFGFLPDGSMVIASMSEKVLYRGPVDALEPWVDLNDGPDIAMLNDLVVASDGTVFVGRYLVGKPVPDGEIISVRPDGSWTVAAVDLVAPNGLGITADGSTLLASATGEEAIFAFTIDGSGSLVEKRTWAALPGRSPDGLCLDSEGGVWFGSAFTGEFLRVTAGGEVTHRLARPGVWTVAPMLGGESGTTLFLLSNDTNLEKFVAGESTGVIEAVDVSYSRTGRP